MITEIQNGIFTGAYEDICAHERDFHIDHVVDVRDLVDNAGNDINDILRFANIAKQKYETRGKVLIVCDMGVSRSRVVAIALLASMGVPFDLATDLVLERCGNPPINPRLLREVRCCFKSDTEYEGSGKTRSRSSLVVGSRGFVGSSIESFLESRGDYPYGIHRANHDLDNVFDLIKVFEKSSATDVIYSINARSFHSHMVLAESLRPLKNVLEACRYTEKRLVYLSSMAVFAGNAQELRAHEFFAGDDLRPLPYGNYSEAKYFAEQLIQIYARNHALKSIVIRPSALYGPGMRQQWIIKRFIRKAILGEDIMTHEYSNGRPGLEFLYISDFVRALYLVLDGPHLGENVLNIGGGKPISTFDLASKIIHLTGSSSTLRVRKISDRVSNVYTAPGLIRSLGWEPSVDLDDGLRFCIADVDGTGAGS